MARNEGSLSLLYARRCRIKSFHFFVGNRPVVVDCSLGRPFEIVHAFDAAAISCIVCGPVVEALAALQHKTQRPFRVLVFDVECSAMGFAMRDRALPNVHIVTSASPAELLESVQRELRVASSATWDAIVVDSVTAFDALIVANSEARAAIIKCWTLLIAAAERTLVPLIVGRNEFCSSVFSSSFVSSWKEANRTKCNSFKIS